MKPVELNINDYHDVIKTFHKETDRAAAVLAGSLIENFLASYLRSGMVDDKIVDELFVGFGPLADFKKRIETAYAFGFIEKQVHRDLTLIAKIRNHFAHHPLTTSFEMSPVSNWCLELSTKNIYPIEGQQPDARMDNRHRYLIAVGLCVLQWNKLIVENDKRKHA
ncbi:MAG: MltR family transcriptional regulator [Gammaproteobacteria bacterium]|nr:MltR family transcriptional regulator [Gammaproteobacteria bacterium]MCW8923797.1 MltR family transcriptional regulator [Gammaproteobacteria bacterium]